MEESLQPDQPDRWLKPLWIVFGALLLLAFVLPPLLAEPGGGLAAAATAAVTFLLCLLLAGVVASILALRGVLRWKKSTPLQRLGGLVPVAIVAVLVLGGAFYLSEQVRAAAEEDSSAPLEETEAELTP
jgi:hypothetical protein